MPSAVEHLHVFAGCPHLLHRRALEDARAPRHGRARHALTRGVRIEHEGILRPHRRWHVERRDGRHAAAASATTPTGRPPRAPSYSRSNAFSSSPGTTTGCRAARVRTGCPRRRSSAAASSVARRHARTPSGRAQAVGARHVAEERTRVGQQQAGAAARAALPQRAASTRIGFSPAVAQRQRGGEAGQAAADDHDVRRLVAAQADGCRRRAASRRRSRGQTVSSLHGAMHFPLLSDGIPRTTQAPHGCRSPLPGTPAGGKNPR